MPRIHQTIYLCILCLVTTIVVGCTGRGDDKQRGMPQPLDSLNAIQKAMEVYDYQPKRALQIIDSAVMAGNLGRTEADFFRARVYSWTQMGQQIDSLLHGSAGVRFDSARVIGERLLANDSVMANLGMHQNVLEVLICTARQQQDTARWLSRSRELVEVCHAQGAETEALRTEAEVGAVFCNMGQREQGMARLDSVIALLDRTPMGFNELDAMIIAMKRKIVVLSNEDKIVETIPLAHRIIDRLNDYEQHPADYHDGTYREPADSTDRADYIQFYRTQAQGFITAAYASLGKLGSMNEVYEQIEHSVRDATAREHIARYRSMEHQVCLAKVEARRHLLAYISNTLIVGMVLLLLFATYIYFQNRKIKRKNKVLAHLIENLVPHHSLSDLMEERSSRSLSTIQDTKSHEDDADRALLFSTIDTTIRKERLYADVNIGRQEICNRFGVRRDVLSQLLSDYADAVSFPAYINDIRLSEVCRLLSEDTDKTVNGIAEEVGLSPRNLRRLFIDQYGMTPTEYRQGLKNS